MRQWRMDQIEEMEARREELRDREIELELLLDDTRSELEDVEYDLMLASEQYYEQDEHEADDNRQRARDLNATLRDIGGGW